MSINLQISKELEELLQKEASKKGMQLDSFLSKFLENSFLNKKNKSRLSAKESDLLQKINEGFSNEFWSRYKSLVRKRQREELTPSEMEELIGMTDKLESSNVERLTYLSELARIKKTTLPVLMKDLGIQPVPIDQ
ncbi:MAG: hypothetical protein R2825_24190 [Saprospiraceae bacterium]